jgi:predicted transcriptional regulator
LSRPSYRARGVVESPKTEPVDAKARQRVQEKADDELGGGAAEMVHEHRERIYIRKDIILKLAEHGELNQSKLMSYCGLNNVKHKPIIDEMVERGLITRAEEAWGSKKTIIYRVSDLGKRLAREILEPYESLFPRREGPRDPKGGR